MIFSPTLYSPECPNTFPLAVALICTCAIANNVGFTFKSSRPVKFVSLVLKAFPYRTILNARLKFSKLVASFSAPIFVLPPFAVLCSSKIFKASVYP